jgi:hypothetical protein
MAHHRTAWHTAPHGTPHRMAHRTVCGAPTGTQGESPRELRRRRRRALDGEPDAEHLSEAAAYALTAQLIDDLRVVADAPTTTGKLFVAACKVVASYPEATVGLLHDMLYREVRGCCCCCWLLLLLLAAAAATATLLDPQLSKITADSPILPCMYTS